MILIISHKQDYTADFVVNKLNNLGIPFKRFNCEDILNSALTLRFGSLEEHLIFGQESYESIWFRRTKLPDLLDLDLDQRFYVLSEVESLLRNLFLILDSKWLSSPEHVYRAENKLFQLKNAGRVDFTIPNTLVTNSKQELIEFFFTNQKKVVIKPLSQTRLRSTERDSFIFTNVLSEQMIESLSDFDLTPCIFQQNIQKDYEIRVTVVGNRCFPAAVYSQLHPDTQTDWRRKRLKFSRIDIPIHVEEKCIALVRELGLKFGAIDLVRTHDDEYIFLENNPNGQWVWIEHQTGLPISEAIIGALAD